MNNNSQFFRGKNGENFLLPFILITSLFFMWGLAHNMIDTLLAAFKKIMSMTNFQTSLIQVAVYSAYFCLALPAAFFIKKYTYQAGVLLGLIIYAGGCFLFLPASQSMNYDFFLFAFFVAAGGCAILETASNPYIITMGSEETATQRLNLAQAFNPLGSITGILLSKFFILSRLNSAGVEERSSMDSQALQQIQSQELGAISNTFIYVGIALVLIFLIIVIVRMPKNSDESPLSGNVFSRLIKNKRYAYGVVAQFFYVGAQIGVWSFTIAYVMKYMNVTEEQASSYYLGSILLFSGFRFVFTALMRIIKPSLLLFMATIAAGILTLLVIVCGGMIGIISLVGISAFMSLMFPTIYGIALYRLGDDTKVGGSGLIMAILGGALLTPLQGKISDWHGINVGYIVPLVCFIVVGWYGIWSTKKTGLVK
jgi:FHS family L-fucose permease-like MFS transporter